MFQNNKWIHRRVVPVMMAVLLSSVTLMAQQPEASPSPPSALVDINTAEVEQLTRIVLDESLAQRIIANRPYANKRQLVSRDLVTLEEYDKFKDRIIARRVARDPEEN